VFLGLCAWGGLIPDGAAQSVGPAVNVLLLNDARVPSDVAGRAQAEVTRLYRLIGVEVTWVTRMPPPAGGRARVVSLVTWEPAETEVPPSVLGFTYRSREKRGYLGYVFWRRVERASQKYKASLYHLLAVAIAHELGHMLLPDGAHSRQGLMTEPWDHTHLGSASAGLLHFSAGTGRLIRRSLNDQGAIAAGRRPN
jgi:hypothetical protein